MDLVGNHQHLSQEKQNQKVPSIKHAQICAETNRGEQNWTFSRGYLTYLHRQKANQKVCEVRILRGLGGVQKARKTCDFPEYFEKMQIVKSIPRQKKRFRGEARLRFRGYTSQIF